MSNINHIFRSVSAVLAIFLVVTLVHARNDAVYKITIDKSIDDVYGSVYTQLEASRFFVVFEPDIGKNIAGFAERWGDEYNQKRLTGLRSMVFCNAWYANQVSNKDPDMLGLCPLHITLYEREGKTTVLFNKPTTFSVDSPARLVIQEIENKVIESIKKGMK